MIRMLGPAGTYNLPALRREGKAQWPSLECVNWVEQDGIQRPAFYFPPGTAPPEPELNALCLAHDAAAIAMEQQRIADALGDGWVRWAASRLKGKTPQEVYVYLQGQIDAWPNVPPEVKDDLKEWIPLMAATLISLIGARHFTEDM